MPLDPDTEIQYRRGGKIMKKTPRKFQAGGVTPAPSPDRVPPAEAAKMKADKAQREREKKEQEAGQRRPDLGKLFKKGGKVRKFEVGGDVTQDTRERRANEKPREEPAPIESRTTPYTSGDFDKRVSPEIDWPSSTGNGDSNEGMDNGDSNVGRGGGAGATEPDYAPPTSKNAAPKKATPKKAAPKAAPKATPKAKPYEPPELTDKERAERSKKEREQGLEGVYPEALLPLGRAASMARNALGRMFGRGAADDAASSAGTALAREAGPRITRLPDGPRVEIPRALPGNSRAALPSPAEGSRAALSGPTPRLPAPTARAETAPTRSAPTRSASPSAPPTPRLPAPTARAESAPAMTRPLTGQQRRLRDLNARNRQALDEKDAAQADRVMAAGKDRADTDRRVKQSMRDFVQSGNYKKGGKVAKYAKGGGVEAKGKTKGKIVKMATGGSVRGYGVSKVTNKTKYC